MNSEKNIVRGIKSIVGPTPEISIGKIIHKSLSTWPNKNHPVLINGHNGQELLSADLLKKSSLLAKTLQLAGYGPDTFITVSSENNLDFFIPIIASLFVGIPLAPLNYNYTKLELEHCINITKPKVIFCNSNVMHKYVDLKKKFDFIERIIIIGEKNQNELTDAQYLDDFVKKVSMENIEPSFKPVDVDVSTHIGFVLCSSGTTGMPKGAMITHKNFLYICNQFRDHRLHLNDIRALAVLPFFHAYGLFTTLISIIIQNPGTVFLTNFQGEEYLQVIEKYRVGKLYMVPPLILFLVNTPLLSKYDLSCVKCIFTGGAPLKNVLEKKLLERFPSSLVLQQAYGLTECTLACSVRYVNSKKEGSSGNLLPELEMGIRDLKTNQFLGPNQIGEICLRGDNVTKGYYGNPKATNETITTDKWLLTGDVGYYDNDHEIFVVDRIKELIKYKGFQVAPVEIEGTLLKNSEILDAAVIGVPDEKAGELPLAFVVKKPHSKLSEQDVQQFIAGLLSPQKWLRGGVVFVDSLPKNPTGKILRKELKNLVPKKSVISKL